MLLLLETTKVGRGCNAWSQPPVVPGSLQLVIAIASLLNPLSLRFQLHLHIAQTSILPTLWNWSQSHYGYGYHSRGIPV